MRRASSAARLARLFELPSRPTADSIDPIFRAVVIASATNSALAIAAPSGAEAVVGPYALQDFFLYYASRFGYRPSKIAFLAEHAWAHAARGAWPDSIPPDERRQYDRTTIKRWLALFLRRFFETGQFMRSALPNGPKVGSGGSLSPRGDWRAPSDAKATAWLDELDRNVP